MTSKEAINDIKVLIEFFKTESGGAYPVCLDRALKNTEQLLKVKDIVSSWKYDFSGKKHDYMADIERIFTE